MVRLGIAVVLLCGQLVLPVLSGSYVCQSAHGCVCVDAGPEHCTCGESTPAEQTSCRSAECDCHRQDETPLAVAAAGGCTGCTHLAVGDYAAQPHVKAPVACDQALVPSPLDLVIEIAERRPIAAFAFESDASSTLAVLSTVVLRI